MTSQWASRLNQPPLRGSGLFRWRDPIAEEVSLTTTVLHVLVLAMFTFLVVVSRPDPGHELLMYHPQKSPLHFGKYSYLIADQTSALHSGAGVSTVRQLALITPDPVDANRQFRLYAQPPAKSAERRQSARQTGQEDDADGREVPARENKDMLSARQRRNIRAKKTEEVKPKIEVWK